MAEAMTSDLTKLLAAHDARVTELLHANNREVERRRAAETRVAELEARSICRPYTELPAEPVTVTGQSQPRSVVGRTYAVRMPSQSWLPCRLVDHPEEPWPDDPRLATVACITCGHRFGEGGDYPCLAESV